MGKSEFLSNRKKNIYQLLVLDEHWYLNFFKILRHSVKSYPPEKTRILGMGSINVSGLLDWLAWAAFVRNNVTMCLLN